MENINHENNNALVVQREHYDWTPDEMNTVRNTCAVNATDDELKMFLTLAARYGLDPFAHEIWFVNLKGRNTIITARDGYLKIANCNPHFLGMDSDVVYSGDTFSKTQDGVKHTYDINKRGAIIGAYAVVYRDDRKIPAFFFAPMKDYDRKAGSWRDYPHAMILKVAEAMALKRAFSISGLVTQEEVGYDGNRKITLPYTPQERRNILRMLWGRYVTAYKNEADAKEAMKKVTGKDNSKDFTDDDLRALMKDIERKENEIDAEFWDHAPDEEPQDTEQTPNESEVDDDIRVNSPEDLGFVKEV